MGRILSENWLWFDLAGISIQMVLKSLSLNINSKITIFIPTLPVIEPSNLMLSDYHPPKIEMSKCLPICDWMLMLLQQQPCNCTIRLDVLVLAMTSVIESAVHWTYAPIVAVVEWTLPELVNDSMIGLSVDQDVHADCGLTFCVQLINH